jgi:hypothetical protein
MASPLRACLNNSVRSLLSGKARRKQAVSRKNGQKDESTKARALKLSGIGVTQVKQSGSFEVTLKFDQGTFCNVRVRDGERHSEVAARLRKLAEQVAALSS